MERLKSALMGNASPSTSDPLADMSPIELLKLRQALFERKQVSPEQQAANLRQTAEEGLGIVPIIGNAIAAKDAYNSGKAAVDSFGRGNWSGGALNTAMAALSGLGAVTGLPTSKMAGKAAKAAPSMANTFLYLPNDISADHLAKVKREMTSAGAPTIRVVDAGDSLVAIEGSHRLKAASELGLQPNLVVLSQEDSVPLSSLDFDFPSIEKGTTHMSAGEIAGEIMGTGNPYLRGEMSKYGNSFVFDE